ncbi:hypothetical protein STEG23_008780 [Scotinomys teguina]
MLAMETVYFAVEDEALLSIYEQTQAASTSQGSASAAEVLLHMCLHVSKPPREVHYSVPSCMNWRRSHTPVSYVSVSMVHKKFNLTEDVLSREHECFAIHRLANLSHLENHCVGPQQHHGCQFSVGLQDPDRVHMDHR